VCKKIKPFNWVQKLKSQQKRVERDQKTAFAEKYERQRVERFRQGILVDEGSVGAFCTQRLLALGAGGREERRRLGTPAALQLTAAGLVDLIRPMGAHI
jgi:hypothetical protein